MGHQPTAVSKQFCLVFYILTCLFCWQRSVQTDLWSNHRTAFWCSLKRNMKWFLMFESFSLSVSNSLFLSKEFGRMEQTAQTLMLCAGHMTDPCWPLPMTLAKCTCSPTPALNQGSVMFTCTETRHISFSVHVFVCTHSLFADMFTNWSHPTVHPSTVFEISFALHRRWALTLPELSSHTVFLCQHCHEVLMNTVKQK